MAERYMEFLSVVMSLPADAGAWVEQEVRLPTSKTELFALLIHFIEDYYLPPRLDIEAEGYYSRTFSLNKAPSTTGQMKNCGYPDNLYYNCKCNNFIETALTNIRNIRGATQERRDFSPPILIAQDTLWWCAENSANVEQATNLSLRIGYTLEKVNREAFIAALVS